jgi:hypothetical protein
MDQTQSTSGSALDLLEQEDRELRTVISRVRSAHGPGVEQRSEYGDLAKSVIRRVATREAALVNVASVAAEVPELGAVSDRLAQQSAARRKMFDRVETMSRGRQGINRNTGQDFDQELTELMQIVGSEIEWDLEEAVPAVRQALEERGLATQLASARTVVKRSPTNLHPGHSHWYERARVVARLIARFDRRRDFSRGPRHG